MSGYTVDLGALRVTAQGIQSVLDELGDLGMNGEQESGSPIEDVSLSAADAGSAAVAMLVAGALQQAHYALRTALHNGNELVAFLHQAAGSYQTVENQVGEMFTTIHRDLTTPAPGSGTTPAAAPADRAGSGSLFTRLVGGGG